MNDKKICRWFEVCPLKNFYQQKKINKQWIENYCWGDYSKCIRKKMEEDNVYHPDNMMPDGTLDENLK
ncbi:uracil-DNA glycosylase [bacterium]|nr:uracil-DNA glycosylase [bacterium]